jgi:uncharacterized protein (TIGR00255 family)
MILSMTGYGKASGSVGNKNVTVEIKSVNSKQLDLNLKLPSFFREKEMALRSILSKGIERGKAECMVHYELLSEGDALNVNTEMVEAYLDILLPIAQKKGIIGSSDIFSSVMRMPEVTKAQRAQLEPSEGTELESIVAKAIADFNSFRKSEGDKLAEDFRLRIGNLTALLTQVMPLALERVPERRERILKALEEAVGKDKVDGNRFEQELIFYLEKLDVTEEEVRLKSHLEYFLSTMEGEDLVGKKLGFIGQEIGREINTLGSKANHSEMQRYVVQMKDELEKIKEQVLNVC